MSIYKKTPQKNPKETPWGIVLVHFYSQYKGNISNASKIFNIFIIDWNVDGWTTKTLTITVK